MKMVSHYIPTHVILGKSLNLTCNYDPEGEQIYQVKWYKDDGEFYTYVPGTSAKRFNSSGVNADNIDVSIFDVSRGGKTDNCRVR